MNKTILTLALVALTALSACKKDDVADTAPAAGDETTMSAPADEGTGMAEPTVTTETTTTETTTTPSEMSVAPDGTTTETSTTTETTTTTEGVAVGEPNPATPAADAPACGDHADLVGKAIADVDTTVLGDDVRVIKPGQPVTMDFRADRINIKLDDQDVVTEVTCG